MQTEPDLSIGRFNFFAKKLNNSKIKINFIFNLIVSIAIILIVCLGLTKIIQIDNYQKTQIEVIKTLGKDSSIINQLLKNNKLDFKQNNNQFTLHKKLFLCSLL